MLMKLQAMVLFAAAASNDEGTAPDAGPRGRRNHSDEDELRQGRVLLEIDGMACEEHSAKDGFVVCTFRAMPPSNPNTAKTIHDCLKVSGSDLCLAADISMESRVVPGEASATHTHSNATNIVACFDIVNHQEPLSFKKVTTSTVKKHTLKWASQLLTG